MTKIVMVVFIGSVLFACSHKPKDYQLIGLWKMNAVYEYNKNVTENHNPKGNRWIKFEKDGTFESDGDPFGRNTGKWKFDEVSSVLKLDSDVEDDDSEWLIEFRNDTLIWTGIGHPRKENSKIIHIRQY